MKNYYIVANWKANKTAHEAQNWLEAFKDISIPEDKKVIVCPPYTLLSEMSSSIKNSNISISLGVQDVSAFGEGAYTGSVTAKQAADFVHYSIVGHSERRKYFHETNEEVIAKIDHAIAHMITPILCISDIKQLEYYLQASQTIINNASKIIFVYEPPSAISGGGAFHAEDPEVANKNASEISHKIGQRVTTLYGGSVNPENAATFFALEHIDGGLIGQASLDAQAFINIIFNR